MSKKRRDNDAVEKSGDYKNRALITVKIRGDGVPNNDIVHKLMPHLRFMTCTKEFAFQMGLLEVKEA